MFNRIDLLFKKITSICVRFLKKIKSICVRFLKKIKSICVRFFQKIKGIKKYLNRIQRIWLRSKADLRRLAGSIKKNVLDFGAIRAGGDLNRRLFILGFGNHRTLYWEPHMTAFGHFVMEYSIACSFANKHGIRTLRYNRDNVRFSATLFNYAPEGVQVLGTGGYVFRCLQWCNLMVLVTKAVVRLFKKSRRYPRSVYYPKHYLSASNNCQYLENACVSPEILAGLGVRDDQRYVVFHCREGSYKSQLMGRQERAEDSLRNSQVERLLPVLKFLVAEGYTVVRFGDPSMGRISLEGVIDLAHADTHVRDSAQFYFAKRAVCGICNESGVVPIVQMFDKPLCVFDATDPLVTFPIRKDSIQVMRHISMNGSRLVPEALFGSSFALKAFYKNPAVFGFEAIDSSRLQQVIELWLRRRIGECLKNLQFHRICEDAIRADVIRNQPGSRYLSKWSALNNFVGRGSCLIPLN